MNWKFFTLSFTLCILTMSSYLYPMDNRTMYVTNLVQRKDNVEFINRSDLIVTYKKYKSFNGRSLYNPYTWTSFDDIPVHLGENIVKDYENSIIYALLQDDAGQQFLIYFKYYCRSSICLNDFEILRLNLNKILLIKTVNSMMNRDTIRYIGSLLKSEFAINVKDLWQIQTLSNENVDLTLKKEEGADVSLLECIAVQQAKAFVKKVHGDLLSLSFNTQIASAYRH